MITLQRPQKSIEQLRALAASGSTSFAKKAQRELQRRKAEELAAALKGEAQ